jgi:hypothetical protein
MYSPRNEGKDTLKQEEPRSNVHHDTKREKPSKHAKDVARLNLRNTKCTFLYVVWYSLPHSQHHAMRSL